MSVLSYRFSKVARILVIDRIVFLTALACFVGSVAGALSEEPKISALVLAGLGDLVLWLRSVVIKKPRVRSGKKEEVETSAAVSISGH
jgi:hypothetical protein